MSRLNGAIWYDSAGLKSSWRFGRMALVLSLAAFAMVLGGCDAKSAPDPLAGKVPAEARRDAARELLQSAPPSAGASGAKASNAPLIVGIEGSSAPFNVVTPRGALVGFDVDVATAVAKRLDRPLRIEVTPLEHAPRVLASGERDLIVSALSVVSDADRRLKDIDLSHAYYESIQVVVVKGRVTGPVDVRTMPRIAVAVATPADQAVTALLGADDRRIARYSSTALALQDLEQGAVAAVVAERGTVLNHLISSPSSSLSIVQDTVLAPPPERYYIAVRKGNQQLLGQVNKALADMRGDGTYDAIYSRYFGPATTTR